MNTGCNGLCDDVILSKDLSVFTFVCFFHCSVVFFRVVKTPENVKTLNQILKGTFLRSPENRFFVTYSIKNTSILSFEKNNLLADSCVIDTDQSNKLVSNPY